MLSGHLIQQNNLPKGGTIEISKHTSKGEIVMSNELQKLKQHA